MTTSELSKTFRGRGLHYRFLGTLLTRWHAMRCYRQERRVIVALSRLDPRLIRDMGFDPEQVYETLDGTWDEVDPADYRSLLPRKDRV